MKYWYVYIIKSQKDGTLYTGITTSLKKRLHKHNSGGGAKYTKGRGPWEYAATLLRKDKSAALKEEARIKGMDRKSKQKLITKLNERQDFCGRPKSPNWFKLNFGPDVEEVHMNAIIFADLRKFGRDILDITVELTVIARTGINGHMFGIGIHVERGRKEHLVKAILKDGTIKTLCDFDGWSYGEVCTHPDCIIRETHDS